MPAARHISRSPSIALAVIATIRIRRSGQSAQLLPKLDQLEHRVEKISVPLSYADELYALRSHIDLIRKRLQAEPS